EAPRFEQALLAGVDLARAEALLYRSRDFLAHRFLDPVAVLRREDRRDAKARRLVEGARAEAGVGAVGEALLLAHARRDARGRGAAEQVVGEEQRRKIRVVVAHPDVLAAAQDRVRLVGRRERVLERRPLE